MPPPPPAPPEFLPAIKAWNLMRGLDWQAIDTVAALIGAEEDLEMLIHDLATLRDHSQ